MLNNSEDKGLKAKNIRNVNKNYTSEINFVGWDNINEYQAFKRSSSFETIHNVFYKRKIMIMRKILLEELIIFYLCFSCIFLCSKDESERIFRFVILKYFL